jgi:hypothetical protein
MQHLVESASPAAFDSLTSLAHFRLNLHYWRTLQIRIMILAGQISLPISLVFLLTVSFITVSVLLIFRGHIRRLLVNLLLGISLCLSLLHNYHSFFFIPDVVLSRIQDILPPLRMII